MHIFFLINGYTKNHGGKRYLTIISTDEKDKYVLKKIYRKNILYQIKSSISLRQYIQMIMMINT